MTVCVRYANGGPKWCTTQPQCLAECRAGWLGTPVGCQDCGRPTYGPFLCTIYDDGSDMVFYSLVCPDCLHSPDPNAGPTPPEREGAMMMTRLPYRKERPHGRS